MKVTVILLVYRNVKYIEQALTSVYKQTYRDIELMISDDCSPDIERGFFEKLEKEARQYRDQVVVNINDENMGTVRHLNKAVRLAKGELICPLSCDDAFYDEHVVEDIVSFALKSKEQVFTAKRMCTGLHNRKREVLKPSSKEIVILEKTADEAINYMAVYGSFISGACTYYKKDIFEEFGYFNEECRLVEDYAYYLSLLLAGKKIGFLDRITIEYRWGGVSTGKKMSPLVYEDMGKILEKILYPNRNRLNKWNRRVIELRYQKRFGDQNRLVLYARYCDIILFWGMRRLFEVVKGMIP